MSLDIERGDLGRSVPRSVRRGGHGIRDVDLPQVRRAIPLDVLAADLAKWNADIERSKRAYYGKGRYRGPRKEQS